MALNLNELQQKLDSLIYNLEQMRQRAWKLFYSPTPENVEIKQHDESGILKTYNIPNRARFQEMVWDDAIAAMSKTFYVNTTGGSDTTGDGTEDNPFRSIKKAINSIPAGGFANIHLTGEDILTSNIDIINKQIIISGGSIGTSKFIVEDNKTGIYCFSLLNSYLQFEDVQITIPDLLLNESKASAVHTGFARLQRGGGVRFYYTNNAQNRINIHNFYLASSIGTGFGFVDLNLANATPKLRINPNKAKLLKLTANTVAFQCPYRAGTIKDFYGNNVDVKKLVEGLVMDSKGNPINMLTNLKFA